MSGLAKCLLGLGKKVGGSDLCANEFTDELADYGVKIDFGNYPDDIENYEAVIYTDAINDENARYKRQKAYRSRPYQGGNFYTRLAKILKR